VVNESKPSRSHMLKQNGLIVPERYFFERWVCPG
jgi:hypothetical protein